MKNIYVTLLSIMVAGAATAQVSGAERGKTPNPAQTKQKPGAPVSANPLKTVIWQSDFTNTGDWVIGNSAGNTADWTISNAPSFWWGSLSSTSGGNMASFDSDGFATGPNQIENNAWIRPVDTLDCSTFPTVAVSFQQYFNKWTGRTFVEVSNDAGASWTDFEVNANMGNNDETTNPSAVTVNISSVAANNDSVLVRILYLSNAVSDAGTDHTAGEAWDYGWIIDDVVIGTLPDNDISLVKAWHGDIVNDYEYSMLPLTQVKEMVPGVVVVNQGGQPQTLDVTCTISDGSGTVATLSQNVTMAIGAEDTLWFASGFTPPANGDYDVQFTIPTDEDPSDDVADAMTLTINDNLMAHDYGANGSYGWNPSGSNSNFADAIHSWGNIYYPTVDQDIYGVDINFAQGTSANLLFEIKVQEIDPQNGIQGTLTTNNIQYYTVQSGDIGSAITTVVFGSPSTLLAGSGYIIDVQKVDPTTGQGFYVGGSADGTEDDDYSACAYGPYGSGGAVNYWVSWGFAPYVRANFDQSLSVADMALEGISVYPNPSEGVINVKNENNTASVVEVFTVGGKKVMSKEITSTSTIDLTGNGTGVYLIKVSNENGSMVERVVIK